MATFIKRTLTANLIQVHSMKELIMFSSASRPSNIFEFSFALWASNFHVLLAWGTSQLAQVFKLLKAPKGSHSVACWNAINSSDLFVVPKA